MSLKIRKVDALYFILIIPFLIPTSLYIYPLVLNAVRAFKLIGFGYSLWLFFRTAIRRQKFLHYIAAYFIILLISTILQNGNIYTWFSNNYPYFSVCVLICGWFYAIGDEALRKISNIFVLFLILNLMSWFMGGLYIDTTSSFGTERMVYFWGIRNSLTYSVFPMSVIILMDIGDFKLFTVRKIIEFLVIGVNIFIAISMELDTAIIGSAFFVVVCIANGNRFRQLPKWNKLIIWLIVAVFVFVSVFGMTNSVVEGLTGVFDKGTTFNGRTYIWASVLSQMEGVSWLFGHGVGNEMSFAIRGAVTNTTHSQYLYILYESGLLGLVFFLWLIYGQLKPLFKFSFQNKNRIIFAGIAAIMVAGIVENICNNCYFYAMLSVVSCYINMRITEVDDMSDSEVGLPGGTND